MDKAVQINTAVECDIVNNMLETSWQRVIYQRAQMQHLVHGKDGI